MVKASKTYRPTDWIDPRIEVRPSSIHGQGMFATAPIEQGQVVTIWGGTLLLTEGDIAGQKAHQWRAKGYVWSTIGEGLYLARLLGKDEQDLTDYINFRHSSTNGSKE